MKQIKTMEIHVLKHYPFSNLNRDQDGQPKSGPIGGYERVRISSQCLKKTIRDYLKANFNHNLGARTRNMPAIVINKIKSKNINMTEDYENILRKYLISLFETAKKDDDGYQTKTIVFYTEDELNKMALNIVDALNNKIALKDKNFKEIILKDISQSKMSPDIAMCGRMVTSNELKSVDSSLQVGHAFSTNVLQIKDDFFTVCDDIKLTDNVMKECGAGHLGDTSFSSNCIYSYYSININQFLHNMNNSLTEDEVKEYILNYVEAIIKSNPAGKQNSFAANQFPIYMQINLKDKNETYDYSNAFVKPVEVTKNENLSIESINKLTARATKNHNKYNINEKTFTLIDVDEDFHKLGYDHEECDSIDELFNKLKESLIICN